MPRPTMRMSCPACGSKVPWIHSWRIPWWSARWPCEQCRTILRFDAKRRVYYAICCAVAVGTVNFLAFSFGLWRLNSFAFLGFELLLLAPALLAIGYYFRDQVEVDIEADPHFCAKCGYSLRGIPEPHTCPECGEPATRHTQVQPPLPVTRGGTLPPSGFDQWTPSAT